MTRRKLADRILTSRDALSKKAMTETIRHHLVQKNGLFLPEVYQHYCQGCGKRNLDPVKYVGEIFCRSCVEKWKAGDK